MPKTTKPITVPGELADALGAEGLSLVRRLFAAFLRFDSWAQAHHAVVAVCEAIHAAELADVAAWRAAVAADALLELPVARGSLNGPSGRATRAPGGYVEAVSSVRSLLKLRRAGEYRTDREMLWYLVDEVLVAACCRPAGDVDAGLLLRMVAAAEDIAGPAERLPMLVIVNEATDGIEAGGAAAQV